jgi:hypothetical protein
MADDYEFYRREGRLDHAQQVLLGDLEARRELQESINDLRREHWELKKQVTEAAEQLRLTQLKYHTVSTELAIRMQLADELPRYEHWAIDLIRSMATFDRRHQKWENCPEIEGVYVLYQDEELLYVGEAANIRKRLRNHPQRGFTTVRYCEVLGGKDARCATETKLVRALNPAGNGRETRGTVIVKPLDVTSGMRIPVR